ncbi:MAG: serine hydrolase [Acidobacteriota bacterium]
MRQNVRHLILIFTVSLILFHPSWAENSSQEEYSLQEALASFEDFTSHRMARDKIPGLSVALLKGDFTWARGFGYSDLENMVPAKAESSYRLASVTKTITSIAVLQLVEQGKIDLKAEVQQYVPYFPRKKWPVRVGHLLGHLGGISHYRNYDEEGHIKEPKDTQEALAIFQDFELVAEPGTKYHYSSYGYNLLGAVIEGASGESYGEYIRKHIFQPLKMSQSRMDSPVALIPNRVRGYRLIRGEIKNSEYVDVSSRFAAGGTRSTVIDLIKYAQGIIQGDLLKSETWRKIFQSMAVKDGLFTGYGMGWRVSPWKGHFQINHSGSQPETRTHLLIFPTEDFAIAVTSNLEGTNLWPYYTRLAELVLNEDMDLAVYVPSRERQLIYHALNQVFSYGMSLYDWNRAPLTKKESELSRAFSYFNSTVNQKSLRKDFKKGGQLIVAGIHPVAGEAFTKVGTFMAATLAEEMGPEKLKDYHRRGPIDFFTDYIKLAQKNQRLKNIDFLDKSFSSLLSQWKKDWDRVYTPYFRFLQITEETDFNKLISLMEKSFKKASIYPDYTRDLGEIARYFLKQGQSEKTLSILKRTADLYPLSVLPRVQLAQTHLWWGDEVAARRFYRQAYELNPKHVSLSLNAFQYFAVELQNEGKIKEIASLGEIALELHPENANLHVDVGDIYLKLGNPQKARELFQKALELDPGHREAKKRLEKIKK